jgi:hypothetical protein
MNQNAFMKSLSNPYEISILRAVPPSRFYMAFCPCYECGHRFNNCEDRDGRMEARHDTQSRSYVGSSGTPRSRYGGDDPGRRSTRQGGAFVLGDRRMVALHTLFIVARLSSARFKKHRVEMETAPAANRANLSLVPTEVVKSSILESPVLAREPQRSAAPPPPLRKVA